MTHLKAKVLGIPMIPLAVLLTSIPPGSRDLLEFGFFVTVGMTAGSLGLI